MNISLKSFTGNSISDDTLLDALKKSVDGLNLSRVLILPPDITRLHSYAGKITAMYYNMLKDFCQVDIMPALGTHDAMTEQECLEFFGPDVPYESIIPHNWRKMSEIVRSAEYVKRFEGLIDHPIDVEVNKGFWMIL